MSHWENNTWKKPFFIYTMQDLQLNHKTGLIIYIELNQYEGGVRDHFPEGEVCHWTWHHRTSVPNLCLNFKWAWASLFLTWPLHSIRHPKSRLKAWSLRRSYERVSAHVVEGDWTSSVPHPPIHPPAPWERGILPKLPCFQVFWSLGLLSIRSAIPLA